MAPIAPVAPVAPIEPVGPLVPVAPRVLSAADAQEIARGQVEERREAADLYEKLGREGEASRLRREATVLAEYLAG